MQGNLSFVSKWQEDWQHGGGVALNALPFSNLSTAASPVAIDNLVSDYCPSVKMGYQSGQAQSSYHQNRNECFMQHHKVAQERENAASAATILCDFSVQEPAENEGKKRLN